MTLRIALVMMVAACATPPTPMERVTEAAATMYPQGTDCLSFATEDDGDIAVREDHGGTCPGDPAVAPVIDRFRVSDGELERYDPADDSWVAN
jgi:hypothetical protein